MKASQHCDCESITVATHLGDNEGMISAEIGKHWVKRTQDHDD